MCKKVVLMLTVVALTNTLSFVVGHQRAVYWFGLMGLWKSGR